FLATCRSYSAESRGRLRDETVRLVRDIAAGHGLTADAAYIDEYPVTVNDTRETEFASRTVADLFGDQRDERAAQPITGAEDFSYVAEQVPGAFLMYGACPPDRDPA